MLKQVKVSLTEYFNSLTLYDYSAFGWLFLVLFFLLIISVIIMSNKPKLASILIFTVFVLIILGPISIKIFLDTTIRHVVVVDKNHTELNFSKYLVVTGKIENRGKIKFHKCFVSAKVHNVSSNKYKNMLNFIKPMRKRTIMLDANILQKEQKEFKVVFTDFDYGKKYSVDILAECY